MCGRYIIRQLIEAERYFDLQRASWTFSASYNVAPTDLVPIVRSVKGVREGVSVRWGLIPYFARGEPGKFSTINARIETLETAASYRGPWQRGQRCLQIASGFYEWHVDGRGRKVPYLIQLADQPFFAFASLWERSRKPDGTQLESCVLITMPGNDLMREIHNTGANPYRMPALLAREDWELWLTGNPAEARAALRQYPADRMDAHEVSPRVNTPKNNDESLTEPV